MKLKRNQLYRVKSISNGYYLGIIKITAPRKLRVYKSTSAVWIFHKATLKFRVTIQTAVSCIDLTLRQYMSTNHTRNGSQVDTEMKNTFMKRR